MSTNQLPLPKKKRKCHGRLKPAIGSGGGSREGLGVVAFLAGQQVRLRSEQACFRI